MKQSCCCKRRFFLPRLRPAFVVTARDACCARRLPCAVFELYCGDTPLLASQSGRCGKARFCALFPGEYTLLPAAAPFGFLKPRYPISVVADCRRRVFIHGKRTRRVTVWFQRL